MNYDTYNNVRYVRSDITNFRNTCIFINNVFCNIDQLYYCNCILLLFISYKRLCMLLSAYNIYFMRGLPHIFSCIYCIFYCHVHTPIYYHLNSLNSYLFDKMKPFNDVSNSKYYTNIFRSSVAVYDSIVLFPVRNICYSKDTPPPHSGGESSNDIHNVCDLGAASHNIIINNNCVTGYDPSSLGNIDPDIHYLGTNNMSNMTYYYNNINTLDVSTYFIFS